jgi:hypothetical protein
LLLCFFILAASGGVHAAAGPKDIVLVLDNSGSMKKNDPSFLTGIAVREFLDRLEGDNRVAILLFDQTARGRLPRAADRQPRGYRTRHLRAACKRP